MAGRYAIAIEWAERAIHRMPRWYFAHFVLAASHVAPERYELASKAVKAFHDALPSLCIPDLDRVPLKEAAKMDAFRNRLRKAGFPE